MSPAGAQLLLPRHSCPRVGYRSAGMREAALRAFGRPLRKRGQPQSWSRRGVHGLVFVLARATSW
eukprot:COSAG01_NODE_19717_length_993_cov_11.819911_1_plen_65_part_00